MYCGKCGAKLADDAKKCPGCGAPVRIRPFSKNKPDRKTDSHRVPERSVRDAADRPAAGSSRSSSAAYSTRYDSSDASLTMSEKMRRRLAKWRNDREEAADERYMRKHLARAEKYYEYYDDYYDEYDEYEDDFDGPEEDPWEEEHAGYRKREAEMIRARAARQEAAQRREQQTEETRMARPEEIRAARGKTVTARTGEEKSFAEQEDTLAPAAKARVERAQEELRADRAKEERAAQMRVEKAQEPEPSAQTGEDPAAKARAAAAHEEEPAAKARAAEARKEEPAAKARAAAAHEEEPAAKARAAAAHEEESVAKARAAAAIEEELAAKARSEREREEELAAKARSEREQEEKLAAKARSEREREEELAAKTRSEREQEEELTAKARAEREQELKRLNTEASRLRGESDFDEEDRWLDEARRIRRYYNEQPDDFDLALEKYGLTKKTTVRLATLFLIVILSAVYVLGKGSGRGTAADPSAKDNAADASTAQISGEEPDQSRDELPTGGGDFNNGQ